MTPYPQTPASAPPPGATQIAPDGQEYLVIPPTTAPTFDCPLVPYSPAPSFMVPVTAPYSLNRPVVGQGFAHHITAEYRKMYWWESLVYPEHIPSTWVDAISQRALQGGNTGNIAQVGPYIVLSYGTQTILPGWTVAAYYAGYKMEQRIDLDWHCTHQIVASPWNPGVMLHYYEGIYDQYQTFTISWFYHVAEQSRRFLSLTPALLACALLGSLPLLTAAAGSIAAGTGRRSRRHPTQKS